MFFVAGTSTSAKKGTVTTDGSFSQVSAHPISRGEETYRESVRFLGGHDRRWQILTKIVQG